MENLKTLNKKYRWKSYAISTLLAGLVMWITGGLYHNLILPTVDSNLHPHHEGLGMLLLAYFILAFLMTYLYQQKNSNPGNLFDGLFFGMVIGILWVFPHGLAMAATHKTSIWYEIKNTFYHMVEQGFGGITIFMVFKKGQY